jgi:hypothetical protein
MMLVIQSTAATQALRKLPAAFGSLRGMLAQPAFSRGCCLRTPASGCFHFAVQNRLTRIETVAIISPTSEAPQKWCKKEKESSRNAAMRGDA